MTKKLVGYIIKRNKKIGKGIIGIKGCRRGFYLYQKGNSLYSTSDATKAQVFTPKRAQYWLNYWKFYEGVADAYDFRPAVIYIK